MAFPSAPRTIHPRQCRAAREVSGLTQAEVAAAIDVSASALSLFEREKQQLPGDAMGRLIVYFMSRRIAFWLKDGTPGIYFVREDGTFSGITIGEGVLTG
ncbi:MAG: helix-turn-helix transcriptional regulator [Pseudomonadota bacterium]